MSFTRTWLRERAITKAHSGTNPGTAPPAGREGLAKVRTCGGVPFRGELGLPRHGIERRRQASVRSRLHRGFQLVTQRRQHRLRRSLALGDHVRDLRRVEQPDVLLETRHHRDHLAVAGKVVKRVARAHQVRSEEHTSELQSHHDLVCRLLLEKKKTKIKKDNKTKPNKQQKKK